jgi:hypothetical protein
MLFVVVAGVIWLLCIVFASVMGFILAVISVVRDARRARWREKYGSYAPELTDRTAPVDWDEELRGWDREDGLDIEEL